MTIDPNIKYLVTALNRIPAVRTFSSCGGHPDPSSCQEAEGTWSVSIELEESQAGWVAIKLLTFAANYATFHELSSVEEEAMLMPWWNNDTFDPNLDCMDWTLTGTVNPALVVEGIKRWHTDLTGRKVAEIPESESA